MSFITKRERVFNEYNEPFDLPSRNEGKLKAYSSCTDARAWSHYWSDKSEYLVEIIKKNTQGGHLGKYVPMHVIIDMLMSAKNAEIARLKRKITTFEQMLNSYEQLELTCEQKCEINTAHAMIKAANRSLDELALDLSGFTEGIDSEVFQTGKSRGDELPELMYPTEELTGRLSEKQSGRMSDRQSGRISERQSERQSGKLSGKQSERLSVSEKSHRGDEQWQYQGHESKLNQADMSCTCEASTSAHDTRIDEYQEALINKDAKLSAMQNTIAVMENDVCEPYCIYAHIYTALAKIFETLRQNDKYKLFLDTMGAGKDVRCLDIKGKILFKLKILEKFSIALLAPCSERFKNDDTCECYTAQVCHVETTFALTSAESQRPSKDKSRAQLIAEIMEHEEMKEILITEESTTNKLDEFESEDIFAFDNYSIDTINLHRLKRLQLNYDDLMTCYENIKHERDSLKVRCQKYEELEEELERLRNQLREYNLLYSEREYFRKRSEDLDGLKEQYLVLSDETSSLETQLKAETEINQIKSSTIEDMRNENIALEKKLNDAVIAFEKEKNALQCKLKETECTVMCQEQQIRSLSSQLDRILEQDHDKQHWDQPKSVVMLDQIDTMTDQINRLKEALYNSEEEKQQLQEQFEDKLKLVSDLRMEIENWKSTYEKTLERNEYLESYTDGIRDEVHRLVEENRTLSQDVEEKTIALGNLINVINNKSQEINKLVDDIEMKKKDNKELLKHLQELKDMHGNSLTDLQRENEKVLDSLQLARQESYQLLEKVKDYDELMHKKEDLSKSLEMTTEDLKDLKNVIANLVDENKRLQSHLNSQENNNLMLMQEIERLRELNRNASDNISILQSETHQYKHSFELTKKESEDLMERLKEFDDLQEQLQNLKISHAKLREDKNKLQHELKEKVKDLDEAHTSIEVTKKESQSILQILEHSQNVKDDMLKLSEDYRELMNERYTLQSELSEKNKDLENLLDTLNILKAENEELIEKSLHLNNLEQDLHKLKKDYDQLAREKATLQVDFDNKTEEIGNLRNRLEEKIEGNRKLLNEMKILEHHHAQAKSNITELQDTNQTTQLTLNAVRKESDELLSKLKNFEELSKAYNELQHAHQQINLEKERLQIDLQKQLQDLKKIENENTELNKQAQNIMSANNDLEKALISARNELIKTSSPNPNIDVIQEIGRMKHENLAYQKQIRDLLDKLDESESIISDLSEEVLARDSKIAILQNHINCLEEEVRSLHASLEEVVNTGEQIKDHSYQKIDQTLNQMEAHHSKATHNMKMELARLQNEKCKLEEELSLTKIKSDESFRDKNKYVSQIINLQNEREIIVTDIKQLELTSVGDSKLSPIKSSVEDVLVSLDRIRKYLETKTFKSSTLEQTLLKVQTSSQLLQSKADEAKKLVEKEKEKIINEKEEAIASKLNMEMQLADLKMQLEQQSNQDKEIIKTLQSELLNQELMINKINTSTQKYIGTLKEELQSTQELYENSLGKINELQEKLLSVSGENNKNLDIINKINDELNKKLKEIAELQKDFDALKTNKIDSSVQTERLIKTDIDVQTDEYTNMNEIIPTDKKDIEEVDEIDNMKVMKPTQNKRPLSHARNDTSQSINEVQILTANIQSSFDVVKNSYINYKIKRLSPAKLENIAIVSSSNVNETSAADSIIIDDVYSPVDKNGSSIFESITWKNSNLVDIYNSQSIHTVSSTAIDNGDNKRHHSINQTKIKAHDVSANNNTYAESSKDKSNENNLFMIYRDSQSSQAENTLDANKQWYKHTPRLVREGPEDAAFNVNAHWLRSIQVLAAEGQEDSPPHKKVKHHAEPHLSHGENRNNKGNNNVETKLKQKIQINMPAVNKDSISFETIPSTEYKSLDSCNLSSDHNLYLQKQVFVQNATTSDAFAFDSIESTVQGSQIQNNVFESRSNKITLTSMGSDETDDKSHHKLSRVDADVLLFKDQNKNTKKKQNEKKQEVNSFGLDYILDSVKQEFDPEGDKMLRKTRSEELGNPNRDTSTTGQSAVHSSQLYTESIDFKHVSNSCSSPQKWNRPRSFAEQSVNVSLDAPNYYENKIRHLTRLLEKTERDYKKKLDAIKIQYDNNIKCMINDHNQGVKSIQGLHEETLQDIIKIHENEVENLRSMSIEAMRKADRLEKENRALKNKLQNCSCNALDEEPVKMGTSEVKKRKSRCRGDTRMLTKTNVEAFNVKPKLKAHGPCTCSLDVNVSDTIRTIFEQVDVEQRKLAEHAYLKYIANKILTGSVESLDAQELAFLHLKVCRIWKSKLTKEEALQKRIDTLESELLNKQRHAQQHIAELDRKVAEERRRLQEAREAVCRRSPTASQHDGPALAEPRPCSTTLRRAESESDSPSFAENDTLPCHSALIFDLNVNERRSAGDLLGGISTTVRRPKAKPENRAVLAKLDAQERRDKKVFDEPPTRLRRPHDRPTSRAPRK